MIVNPNGINFVDWASSLVIDLPDLDIPVINDEDEWKQWALFVIEENKLGQFPLPENFSNWREWANYLTNYM